MRLFLAICLLTIITNQKASAQENKPMIRIARIVVDSAQLVAYRAALKEGIETAVRVEPGVLSLYAVYDREHPTHVTVFEIYADETAYHAHLQTPHFIKYKETVKDMVRSLELIDAVPIGLESKPKS
jgi:quinol monooxygenase YgiN